MKGTAIAVVAVVLFSALGERVSARRTGRQTTEEQLLALDHQWSDANVRGDAETLGRILADDFIATDAQGVVWTKAEMLEAIGSGRIKTQASTTYDYRVRVYGDVAVMTHGASVTRVVDGKNLSGRQRSTHVFVRRGGRWQAVANHVTKVTEP